MKLKISELHSNPFKKHINDGKLEQSRVDKLIESINHGTLPEIFSARKDNGIWEIPYGHHRLEALRQTKGDKHEVEVVEVKYNDEQMLVDMVRENLTHRDTDYRDVADSVMLTKRYIESDGTVKSLYSSKKTHKKEVGSREIADFISKEGKTISHGQVCKYLKIEEEAIDEVKEAVTKGSQGHTEDGKIGLELTAKLATFTKAEQKKLFPIVKNMELGQEKITKLLTKYREAPDDIKKRVLDGDINIENIEEATYGEELKEKAEKRPKTIFIPNLAERMKQFNKDVHKLETQVKLFNQVFHSKDFEERYNSLKVKQQETLNKAIYNIKERIENCYNEINFYVEKLSGNIIEIGGKEK